MVEVGVYLEIGINHLHAKVCLGMGLRGQWKKTDLDAKHVEHGVVKC